MDSIKHTFNKHRLIAISIFAILAFVVLIRVFAVAPNYDPGETLDPTSGPGVSTVRIFPDQAGHSGEFLTTDGSDISWDAVSGGVTGSGAANLVAYWNGANSLTGSGMFTFTGDTLKLGVAGDDFGNLTFLSKNSFFETTIRSADTPTEDYTMTLPPAQGAADTFLKNNGGGILSWAAAGGGFIIDGNDNMFAGPGAGSSLTSGANNFFAGISAGNSVSTANRNTFIGFEAGISTNANENTFIGYNSGVSNTGGINNTAVGSQSFISSAGSNNSAFGRGALSSSTSGDSNTAIGVQALQDTTGNENTAVGQEALRANVTGSSNTAIGYFADAGADNLTNATAIGAYAIVGASNSLILGQINGVGFGTVDTKVGIGTSTPGSKLHISGGDLYIDNNANGIILRSPDNTCHLIAVDNSNVLSASTVTCP